LSAVPGNHDEFLTHWRVRGTLEEVSDVLGNSLDLGRWWPAVCLSSREVDGESASQAPPRAPSWSCQWAMARGAESLKRALLRRRACVPPRVAIGGQR